MGQWLIPWQERGRSGPIHDNFLWHSNNLYVMDNHRLALWCWWQRLEGKSAEWDFVHIDRHYDALWQNARPWLQHFDPIHKTQLDSFRRAKFSDGDSEMELYRWDVITSALATMDGNKIHDWIFATAEEGSPLLVPPRQTVQPWNVPALVRSLSKSDLDGLPVIMDIDLDYFTHVDKDNNIGRVFSSQYLHEINEALIEGLSNKRFDVVTIALSPSTTGSWELAEELCWELLNGVPELSELQTGAP